MDNHSARSGKTTRFLAIIEDSKLQWIRFII